MRVEHGLSAGVVLVGLACLLAATDGLRAFTSEGARRLAVERAPRALKPVALVDHTGATFSWSDYAGQPVLVEFIFTTCPTVCQRMSSDLRQLVADAEAGPEVGFVSVSFDLENDSVEQLARTAARFGADGRRWRFARVRDAADLAPLLDTFGIVAIPSPRLGFEHNTAIHGIDRSGRLARIRDIEATEAMLAWAQAP